MAVAFDAKATSPTDSTAGGTSPLNNTNLTIGGTGTCIVAAVVISRNDATALVVPSAVTWNGIAMTLIASKVQSDGNCIVYGYGLQAPTTGNHTLSCTFSPTLPTNQAMYLDGFSFSGTDTSSFATCFPAANVLTDASTTPSGTTYPQPAFSVTTASGDAACAVMQSNVFEFTSAAVGTLINESGAVTGDYASLYHLAGGASTSCQFGGGGAGIASGIAFRIAQAAVVATLMGQAWM